MRIQRWMGWMGLALGALWVGCGGGSNNSGSATPPPPQNPVVVIAIDANGVRPKDVIVGPGGQVTFQNNDSMDHEIASDPHPQHTDCPELNVGRLGPGMKWTATMGSTPMTCGFHDHLNPNDTHLQGSVTVSSGATGGGG